METREYLGKLGRILLLRNSEYIIANHMVINFRKSTRNACLSSE